MFWYDALSCAGTPHQDISYTTHPTTLERYGRVFLPCKWPSVGYKGKHNAVFCCVWHMQLPLTSSWMIAVGVLHSRQTLINKVQVSAQYGTQGCIFKWEFQLFIWICFCALNTTVSTCCSLPWCIHTRMTEIKWKTGRWIYYRVSLTRCGFWLKLNYLHYNSGKLVFVTDSLLLW